MSMPIASSIARWKVKRRKRYRDGRTPSNLRKVLECVRPCGAFPARARFPRRSHHQLTATRRESGTGLRNWNNNLDVPFGQALQTLSRLPPAFEPQDEQSTCLNNQPAPPNAATAEAGSDAAPVSSILKLLVEPWSAGGFSLAPSDGERVGERGSLAWLTALLSPALSSLGGRRGRNHRQLRDAPAPVHRPTATLLLCAIGALLLLIGRGPASGQSSSGDSARAEAPGPCSRRTPLAFSAAPSMTSIIDPASKSLRMSR